MPVDKTAYYDDLKARFQTWKRLRGQQAEAEVNRLLALHDQLLRDSDMDPELAQVLAPIKQELEEALAKGFEEPTTSGPSDPNSIR